MADQRFFKHAGALSLDQIMNIGQLQLAGNLPAGITKLSLFTDVATLHNANREQIAVFHNRKYLAALEHSQAGIIITETQFADRCPDTAVVLTSASPYRSYAHVSTAFYPDHDHFGTDTTAQQLIHASAKIGKNCTFEAGVVIGEDAEIGDETFIGANSVIGRGVKIGNNCRIASNVTVAYANLGNNIILHTGVRIGQAGFGFHMDKQGHFPVPQLGRVIIEDYVDIGANTTIDRGSNEDTTIGAGTRIDNLVMIAHNVHIGRGCVIVAQVGISGSTKVGDYTAIGGQAGLVGHLTIGKGVQIAAQSGIMRDIPDGMIVGGSPAVPAKQWHRQTVILEKLANKKGEIA